MSSTKTDVPGQPPDRSTAPAAPRLKPERPANLQRDARMLVVVVGVFLLMIVAGAIYGSRDGDGETLPSKEPEGVQLFSYEPLVHTNEPVTYAEVPPVGGPHATVWQNCGFYAGAVPSERAVHSLEHGAVWITYRPDLPQEQVAQLRAIAERNNYVLVSPFADLPAPVVASAWNHQLAFDSPDAPELAQFIAVLQQGPETPEPGAPCSGGSSDLAI
jgi:hypothetical protein